MTEFAIETGLHARMANHRYKISYNSVRPAKIS